MPYENLPKTRAEAKRLDVPQYFSGKPCKHGHISPRTTFSRNCMECNRKYYQDHYKRNASDILERKRFRYYNKRRDDYVISDEPFPRTRVEAKYLGSKYYFTGKPCKHGHTVIRRTTDGSCLECARNRARGTYFRNLESKKKRDRLYYQRNREVILVKGKTYRESLMGQAAGKSRDVRRRIREIEVPGTHTAEDLIKIIAMGKKCFVCGKRFTKSNPPTIEHVIAISHELGTNDAGNLAPSHLSCNLSKSASRFNPVTGQGILI